MKSRRIITILITLVCIFALLSVVVSASGESNSARIIDKENYISASDEIKLEQRLKEAEQKSGVDFRVYVHDYSFGVGSFDMYDYERVTGQSFENLVLLVVSYEYGEYYYELFTKGSADTLITDKEVNKILDNDAVYDNIKSGKLYEGIDTYITLSEKAVTGNLRNSLKSVLIVSIIISVVTAGISVLIVVLKYRKKLHSVSYPLDKYARLDLNVRDDNFINKTVTRVRVNSSSGSGGGRGRSFGGGSRGRR